MCDYQITALKPTNARVNAMTYKEFKKLVAKFGGWIEGEIAYFPTVYQKEQFEKAAN